ncbi:MAG: penicillin-binding protein 2 [bacterium]|nr:penicillin-binding protein 2 [bacterium]
MSDWRLNSLPLIFFLVGAAIIVRLFYWQIVKGEELAAIAERQHFESLEIPALRGEIRASDGSLLVGNQGTYLVYAEIPKLKKNASEVAHDLAPILALTEKSTNSSQLDFKALATQKEESIKVALERENAVWVPLAHKIEDKTKREIENLSLSGLGFEREDKRYYPEASMAAHLFGFVGSNEEGSDQGYFGVEGKYNLELKGRPGFLRQEKDAQGRPILLGKVITRSTENGRDLVLGIDRTAQFIVEKRLKEGIEKYGAKSGTVAVMEPQTGQILAMASFPHYDPDKFFLYDSALYPNPAVAFSYEPGSTFKVLVMAAALNEGVVAPETKCDKCGGPRTIADYTIRTWNDKYYPDSTMMEVLEHSDNVGMVFVSEKLGQEKLYKYLLDFGIGQSSGIDLQEESSPALRPKKEWYSIDWATAAFGQGVAVTPIQMLRAVGAIANEGKLTEPHVVKEVVDAQGKVMKINPKVTRQVVSSKTAKVLTEMMINAVEKGEAKWAKPEGFRIAGKTGTAQIPISGHYDQDKTIASFVGFAPADNPRFTMIVTLSEPTSSPWGSETAAPLWFGISRDLFNYFGITPSQ